MIADPQSIPRSLTPRQCEVLAALGRCTPRKQIASDLGITEATLDRHIQDIYARLGIHSVSEATRAAILSEL